MTVNRRPGGGADLEFKTLMEGGLVAAAVNAAEDETGIELVNQYFGSAPSGVRADCKARALDGAMNGALGMGMVLPGLVSFAPTALGGVALLGLSAAGAAGGFVIGGNAARESCNASKS
eukprot:scaffold124093_cov26-Tisochrysis_lutea.AAC.1